MEELEYITDNALIMCDQGGAPAFLNLLLIRRLRFTVT